MAGALFLSIQPKYTERILHGIKTVELRRIRPSISKGDMIVIYSTSPKKEIMAISFVQNVVCSGIDNLWRKVKDKAGITRNEFDNYFKGAKAGVAIYIRGVKEFSCPITLSTLRKIWPDFRPPQSYRYVSEKEVSEIYHLMK
jgi:predicted transcriptional regulator